MVELQIFQHSHVAREMLGFDHGFVNADETVLAVKLLRRGHITERFEVALRIILLRNIIISGSWATSIDIR